MPPHHLNQTAPESKVGGWLFPRLPWKLILPSHLTSRARFLLNEGARNSWNSSILRDLSPLTDSFVF